MAARSDDAANPRARKGASRAPTPGELERMQALVRAAMEEGAMGVASALIYPSGFYAKTDELIALCRAAALYGGREDRLVATMETSLGGAQPDGVR